MNARHAWWTSLVIGAGAVPGALAQQAVPAPPAAAGAALAAAPAAAPAPMTLWSFLGCSWEQKEECRRHLCALQCGQMLNNATAPLGAITGGLIPSFCPQTPTAAQLAEPGAVGAAAKIKADEAAAKERRAAVRYLGTVDCHYWPEAQDALIAALRSDRNECVRYEAALALGNGCCCTKATIEALMIVISCENRDGFPKETSPRVHNASRAALERCTSCYQEPAKEIKVPPPPEGGAKPTPPSPEGGRTGNVKPEQPRKLADRPVGMSYYARINQQPMDAVVREAHRVLSVPRASVPSSSGMSLARLIDQASGAGEVRGYVVHEGKIGSSAVVAEKPTNLWDMLTRSNRPVIVTSAPLAVQRTDATTVRLTPQASSAVVHANVQPTSAPAQKSMAPAMAAATAPANTPARIAYHPAPMPPAPSPAMATPRVVPVKPAIVAPKPDASLKPVQNIAPPSTPAPVVATAAAPKSQTTHVMTDQERAGAVNALAVRQATPEIGQKLLRLARIDRSEEVRCAAIRAIVRTNVAPDLAIPVLAQLAMSPETKVGKSANSALAEINLRCAGGSK